MEIVWRRHRSGFACATSIIALVNCAPAWAQDASSARTISPVQVEGEAAPASSQVGPPPPPYAGGQVATQAQLGVLGNAKLQDVPLSITAYTGDFVVNKQANTVADVLSADPSAAVFSSNRAGTVIEVFTLRGFAVNAFNVTFQGLGGLLGISEPVQGVDRVEVLQGPSSLLNGFPLHGGIGGTINFVPARATDQPLTRLTAGYQSDTQFSAQADVGRRFGSEQQFGLRVGGLFRDGDTAVDHNHNRLGLVTAGFDYLGDGVRLSADVRYQDSHNRDPLFQFSVLPGFAIPKAPDAGTSYTQRWTFQNFTNIVGAMRGEVDVAKDVTLFAAVGAHHLKGQNLVTIPTLTNAAGRLQDLYIYFANDFAAVTGEAGLRAHFATGRIQHQVTIAGSGFWENRIGEGGSYYFGSGVSNLYNPVAAPSPNLALIPPFPPNSHEYYRGLTVSDTLSILDGAIQLTPGVRLQNAKIDVKNMTTGVREVRYKADKTAPFVGLTVKPMQNLSLYGSYSQGLDVGGAAPAGTVNAGTFLPPATLKQKEVGIKYDAGTMLIHLSLFDLEQQTAFTDPVTRIYSLTGRQRNRGGELTVAGEPVKGFRLLGGAMYLDGQLRRTAGGANDGNTAVGVPKWTFNMGGEVDILSSLTLTGRVVHTSREFVDIANTQTIADWTRFDLGARSRIDMGGKPVTFRLTVENVANKGYYASAISGLTLGAPRTVALSASIDL